MFFFLALITLVGGAVSYIYSGEFYMTVGIFIGAIIYAAISYYSGSKAALALNGAKEVTDSTDRLYKIVENLAITNGMPMPKVYLIDDPGLNAFATGRDPDHAMVAATSGLASKLTDPELEGVMAHELGHVKNYDIRVSLIAFALVAAIAVLSDIILRSFFWGGNRRSSNSNANGYIMVIGIIVVILAPIAAQMLKLALSRKREYLADATGAMTTRYPEGLASALEKIKTNGPTLQRQNTATAHLFFANPLKGKKMSSLFETHPPIDERIARLNEMGNKL